MANALVTRLTREQIHSLLKRVPLWNLDSTGSKLVRRYKFGDFNEAFGFMTRVAIYADKVCFLSSAF
jgi:4a-hydroxytetrahydrobiopterin dehydratase